MDDSVPVLTKTICQALFTQEREDQETDKLSSFYYHFTPATLKHYHSAHFTLQHHHCLAQPQLQFSWGIQSSSTTHGAVTLPILG